MNEETIQLIRDLATQLGTTSERLWGVLVHGVIVRSAIYLTIEAVALAVVLYAGRALWKWVRSRAPREDTFGFDDDISWVGGIGLTVVAGFLVYEIGQNAIGLAAPEYAALVKLLNYLARVN